MIQFKPVPFEEAAKIVADRPVVSRDVFKKLLPEIRARAFLVSGVEDLNVVQQIRDLIAEIPRGGSWEGAKEQIVEKLGPWMNDEAAEKRAILLMRHHGFQAYAAAQHEVMMEQKEVLPYWKYLTLGDERVRESHAALHGLILPADDPFWKTHYPPWDWGCRCRVIAVTEGEYQETVGAGRVAGNFNPTESNRTKGWALGKEATRSLHNGKLDMGDGMPIDVRAPVQRATNAEEKAAAYQWNPDDLRLNLEQLESRYDSETWAMFVASAKAADLGNGISVWAWLNGKSLPAGILPPPKIIQPAKAQEISRKPKTAAAEKPDEKSLKGRSAAEKRRVKIQRAVFTDKRFSGGGVNGSWILKNGDKVLFKPADEERHGIRKGIANETQYRREIAASIVDELLGFDFVPPTTLVEYEGQSGSAQAFINSAKTAQNLKNAGLLDLALGTIPRIECEKFLLLDEVLYNTDRHSGNYMLKKGGDRFKLFAIDNGLSLPTEQVDSIRLPNHRAFERFRGRQISDDALGALKKFREAEKTVRAQLGPWLDPDAIDNMFHRVDNLLKKGRHMR